MATIVFSVMLCTGHAQTVIKMIHSFQDDNAFAISVGLATKYRVSRLRAMKTMGRRDIGLNPPDAADLLLAGQTYSFWDDVEEDIVEHRQERRKRRSSVLLGAASVAARARSKRGAVLCTIDQ